MKLAVNIYCMIVGMIIVYGKAVLHALDWLWETLADLIDNSDLFAGFIATLAVISVLELLTRG